jgi:ADP-heptose:LPS heptosyltransferase
VGFGDEIMGSGLARGAKLRGEKVAFGARGRIMWSKYAAPIYLNNLNVARPGEEFKNAALKWVAHYPGNRAYNRLDHTGTRWIWNYDFKAQPGEIFLSYSEQRAAEAVIPKGVVLIEPNVPMWKKVAINKLWRGYQEVANRLTKRGIDVIQFDYPGIENRLRGVRFVKTPSIRIGLAYLSRISLYIGPEGGLHHGAAAFNIPAVVLFGGFIPPAVTGYQTHANLTGGTEACGSIFRCMHCEIAMKRIKTDEVMSHAYRLMNYEACSV